MRPKKTKKIRKSLEKLQHNFFFRKPFQILLDDSVITYLEKAKFPITVINNTFTYPKIFTTRCIYKKHYTKSMPTTVVDENAQNQFPTEEITEDVKFLNENDILHKKAKTNKLDDNNVEALKNEKKRYSFAKHLGIRNCLHKTEVDSSECIKKFVRKNNKNHYFIGSLFNNNKYSGLKNVPLMIFNRSDTIILDLNNFYLKEEADAETIVEKKVQ